MSFNLSENIYKAVEDLVEDHDLSLIDAIVHYAEKSGLEIELIAEALKKNEPLKARIELEAESLHFLRKKNRLPI